MTAPALVRAGEPQSLEEVRDRLQDVFVSVKEAVAAGSPVLILVPAGDLLGHRSVYGAAYANALVGLVRAVGFEGARAGWRANVVAVPDGRELDGAAAVRAVGDLDVSGQVLTLGTGLVGKVIP